MCADFPGTVDVLSVCMGTLDTLYDISADAAVLTYLC
jgi:hypothetical protein